MDGGVYIKIPVVESGDAPGVPVTECMLLMVWLVSRLMSDAGDVVTSASIGDNFRQKLEIWSRNPATAQRQVE